MAEEKTGHRAIAPAVAGRYLLAVLAGVLGAGALFIAALAGLGYSGNLPPPAFANSLCADEKLNFLRQHPVDPPNLLVIGSSVAWRHIDGATLVEKLPGTKPLNAGFCGLRANQSVFVANWMLDRYPGVRRVLMVVSPQDLTRCSSTPPELFNRQDADRFVYERVTRWPYYFKYFDPVSLVRAALTIKDRRAGKADFDNLVFSAYGDGPLDIALTRELGSEEKDPLDPTCFTALRSLAQRLEREGISFSLVTTPIHPEWISQDRHRSVLLKDLDRQLGALAQANAFSYWNAAEEWATPTASFTDAIHLRWQAARKFTAAVARHLSMSLASHTSEVQEQQPEIQQPGALSTLDAGLDGRRSSTADRGSS